MIIAESDFIWTGNTMWINVSVRHLLWSGFMESMPTVRSCYFPWDISFPGASLAVWLEKNAGSKARGPWFESQILQLTNYRTLVTLLNDSELPFLFL